LFGLCRLKGLYFGENIAEIIIAVVETYEIINKIGYFVFDNAKLNNICINAIIEQF